MTTSFGSGTIWSHSVSKLSSTHGLCYSSNRMTYQLGFDTVSLSLENTQMPLCIYVKGCLHTPALCVHSNGNFEKLA